MEFNFLLGLGLVLFAAVVVYLFRNENKK